MTYPQPRNRRRRGPVYGGGTPAFDPVSLNPIMLQDFRDGSLFQDVAGTTPAAAHTDPVARSVGRASASDIILQSTDSLRPTLDFALGNGRGPEKVTNGDFSDGLTGWEQTGDAFSAPSGSLIYDATGSGVRCGQNVGFAANQPYEITFDCNLGSTFRLQLVNSIANDNGALIVGTVVDGPNSFTVTPTSNFDYLVLRRVTNTGADTSFDNVSVRDVLRDGPRGIRFNGTSQFLDATGLTAATGPKTVIAGCITEDGETSIDNYLFDTQSGRIISGAVGNTVGQAGMFSSGGGWTSGGNYDTEALAVLTFRHYAADGGIRANGVEVLTENVFERAIGGAVSVGSATGGVSGFLNGVIHVLLVFDRALTGEEIVQCENWIATRQGRTL